MSIVILGGLATIWGSLLGAMAFVLLEEGMRFIPFIPAEYTGPGAAGNPRHPAGAADAVPAPGTGREVSPMSMSAAPDASPGRVPLALETVAISKRFGAVHAVDALSLAIPRQGTTSIVGPNGSGKSTLVNLLSGVLPLDGGMVIIDGASLRVVKAYETPAHASPAPFRKCACLTR